MLSSIILCIRCTYFALIFSQAVMIESRKKFSTDREVASLSPLPGQKQTEFFHKNKPGLILRVGQKKKVWVIAYTVDGKRRKYTLKKGYPDIGLGEAVKIYNEIKAKAISGDDPLAERVKQKAAPTIQDVMGHYFAETSMAPKTRSESVRLSDKDIIPVLGRKRAIDLTRQDVKALHRGIVERGASVMANRTVELLRRAYNCAYGEELIDINPFPNLKKIQGTESPRDKVLKDSEIKAIWTALERESPNMRDIMRLLLLLGQRSMETMSMAVGDIDQTRMEWTVPANRTKTGKINVVPLPEMAWRIIEPRLTNSKWIFPSFHNATRVCAKGDGHSKSTKDARRRLRKVTGIDNWTAHDLRRTCRTIMAREGVPPHIAEQVLGHVQSGIEGVYDQHTYIHEKRQALEKVEAAIRKLLVVCE